MAGLLICPFGVQLVRPHTGVSFALQARKALHPPYRLLFHGDVRSSILVREMLFDGGSASGSFTGSNNGQAMSGEIFGPLLFEFWAPVCPEGKLVQIQVENASAATVQVAATLLASPAPEPQCDGVIETCETNSKLLEVIK